MQKMQYEEASIEIIEFGIAYTSDNLIGVSKGDNNTDIDIGGF